MKPPVFRLAAIVVHDGAPDFVETALASLESELDPECDVAVVVDSAPQRGPEDRIAQLLERRGWQRWAHVLRARARGFAAEHNLAIRSVQAEFYLLLSSDAYLRRGALRELLSAAGRYPFAGVVSPLLEAPSGDPEVSCFRFPSACSELADASGTGFVSRLLGPRGVALPASDGPSLPDWTSFACVVLSSSALRAVGLLDEGYSLHYQDVDYCRRVRQAGLEVLHWPAARVVHMRLRAASSTFDATRAPRQRLPSGYFASRARYFASYHGVLGLWRANALWLLGRGIAAARELVGHKLPHTSQWQALDIWRHGLRPLAASRHKQELS
jgi:GT2 family glycosyltransferase